MWSYDFVSAFTHDGRTFRLLTLIDGYTRKCLALRVALRLNSYDLIETLADVMLEDGVQEHLRSDKWTRVRGAEAAAAVVGHGSQDAVHRTRQSLGERLLRVLQWEAAG